jgi:S-adenosylmethionine:tRNA ribosyltransferase-isomerase
MKTTDFDYHLPLERIAQTPVEPRHSSRLLVLDRAKAELEHASFWQIQDYLREGDLLVINRTKVIPARLFARKETGGRVEILLLRRQDAYTWEALVGGKRLTRGKRLQIEDGPGLLIEDELEGSRRMLRFDQPVETSLSHSGHMPLPPYIHEPLKDPQRYQTVYAQTPGSAAAPTAGLHFTPELMSALEAKGVRFAGVTLHVGLDTFMPVSEDDPREHIIHTEWCEMPAETAAAVNATKHSGGRVISVGTTSVRTLESSATYAQAGQTASAFAGPTALFILPGYSFQVVDAIVTNFHLPKSSLIMLISAFAGRERVLSTYQTAVEMEYRFYSFGDAMLIK